jgi:hypothetical protein
MNLFKILFPAPTKQKTLEQLASAKAELDVLIRAESMSKYFDRELFGKIGKLFNR